MAGWGGCWEECWKKIGVLEGLLARVLLSIRFEGEHPPPPPSQHPRQNSCQHSRISPAPFPASSSAIFLDSPSLYSVAGRPGPKSCLCFSGFTLVGGPKLSERIKHAPNRGYRFVSPLPPLSLGGSGPFPLTENPLFCGKSYYFYRISCMNPLFFSTEKLGAKRDAKWWTSIRCMFDSL